jgi:hypothetical protein
MNPVRISGLFLVSMLAGALTYSLPSRPSRAAATTAPAVDDDGITCLEYCQSEEALCRGACKDDAACACACGTGPRSCSSICGVPNPDPPDGCDGPGPGRSSCRDQCFYQFQRCQGDCFTDPACPCRCRNDYERCRSFCDGEEPFPPEFCGDPLQR